MAAFLTLGASASVMAQTVFIDDFGDSAVRATSPYVPQVYVPVSDVTNTGNTFSHGEQYYKFGGPADTSSDSSNARNIDNGYYAVALPRVFEVDAPFRNESWYWFKPLSMGDYSGSAAGATPGTFGAVMALNAGSVANEFYRRSVQLEPGASYRMSAAFYVTNSPVQVRFEAQETSQGQVLGMSPTIAKYSRSTNWELHSWDFSLPAQCDSAGNYSVSLRNLSLANSGNDLYIDDIKLEKIASSSTPVNCAPAPAVTIAPADDSYTFDATGGTQGSVIDNDQSNGAAAVLGNNATLTPRELDKTPAAGSILMNADGSITVAANTTPGTYTYTYELCTLPATTPFATCKEAVATIVVQNTTVVPPAPTIQADDDDFTTTPVESATGGTTTSLVSNDKVNNGSVVLDGATPNAKLTPTALPQPSTGGFVINPDGTVTIAAGTPAGDYEIRYLLCVEPATTPATCDNATALIKVDPSVIPPVPPTISANNDGTYTVTSSSATQTTSSVLDNDTLNGQPVSLPDVELTVVKGATPTTPGALVPTLDLATGTVVIPAGTPSGDYQLSYQICANADTTVCAQAEITVKVEPAATTTPPTPPTSGVVQVPANSTWMLVLSALAVLVAALGIQRQQRRTA